LHTIPDVGREISDHVDIGNDEVVLKEEVAQELPLLVRVAVRLLTQQAAHLLTKGNVHILPQNINGL
jgi:hypothetical protein